MLANLTCCAYSHRHTSIQAQNARALHANPPELHFHDSAGQTAVMPKSIIFQCLSLVANTAARASALEQRQISLRSPPRRIACRAARHCCGAASPCGGASAPSPAATIVQLPSPAKAQWLLHAKLQGYVKQYTPVLHTPTAPVWRNHPRQQLAQLVCHTVARSRTAAPAPYPQADDTSMGFQTGCSVLRIKYGLHVRLQAPRSQLDSTSVSQYPPVATSQQRWCCRAPLQQQLRLAGCAAACMSASHAARSGRRPRTSRLQQAMRTLPHSLSARQQGAQQRRRWRQQAPLACHQRHGMKHLWTRCFLSVLPMCAPSLPGPFCCAELACLVAACLSACTAALQTAAPQALALGA